MAARCLKDEQQAGALVALQQWTRRRGRPFDDGRSLPQQRYANRLPPTGIQKAIRGEFMPGPERKRIGGAMSRVVASPLVILRMTPEVRLPGTAPPEKPCVIADADYPQG